MQQNFSFEYLKQLKELLDIFPHERFEEITQTLLSAYDKGKHIFIMGNGGSGSTASHFVCDINKGSCLELEKKFKSGQRCCLHAAEEMGKRLGIQNMNNLHLW